jgi:ABC-type Fe3+/spermidine/putrescine transport system ATPase subunit
MDFVGRVNYVAAEVMDIANGTAVVRSLEHPEVQVLWGAPHGAAPGDRVTLCVRPEDIHLTRWDDYLPGTGWKATVEAVTYLGNRVEYLLRVGPLRMQTEGAAMNRFQEGDVVRVQVPEESVRVWKHQAPAAESTPEPVLAAAR